MTPRAQIATGLALVSSGLVALRAEREALTYALAENLALDVDTEHKLRVDVVRAMAARRPRALNARDGGGIGPRAQLLDGNTITEAPTLDTRTEASLRRMGLAPLTTAERDERRAWKANDRGLGRWRR